MPTPASDTVTARQVVLSQPGGPEALTLRSVALPPPGPGEVLIRQTAVGVNFVDIYHRTGLYALPPLPVPLGVEGAGVVTAVGPGVTTLSEGQTVAYAGLPVGGYASHRLLPEWQAMPVPDGIADSAAAAMLRGITTHMLLTRVFPVGPDTTLLVHAAAGGLGLILTQWARRLGATVIGTVSSEDKAVLARSFGTDHTILYRQQDFVQTVRDLTGGQGVDYAIDGIGGETLRRTLDTVRPFGMVASVGQASGSLPDIPLTDIGPGRTLSLSRPSVFRYLSDPATYRTAAAALLAQIGQGLRPVIGLELPLDQAAEAHRALEAGRTCGSILLRP